MASTHVPVEILRLHVKSENIGKQFVQSVGDCFDSPVTEIGPRLTIRRRPVTISFFDFH
jgi:hypothetical protein